MKILHMRSLIDWALLIVIETRQSKVTGFIQMSLKKVIQSGNSINYLSIINLFYESMHKFERNSHYDLNVNGHNDFRGQMAVMAIVISFSYSWLHHNLAAYFVKRRNSST